MVPTVKTTYEKVVQFIPNTHTVPANNVRKKFCDLYADTLEMADSNETKNHFGWYANMILHHHCPTNQRQESNRKTKDR